VELTGVSVDGSSVVEEKLRGDVEVMVVVGGDVVIVEVVVEGGT